MHSLSSSPVLTTYISVHVSAVTAEPCPCSICIQVPVSMSHSRTVPSSEPLAAAYGDTWSEITVQYKFQHKKFNIITSDAIHPPPSSS